MGKLRCYTVFVSKSEVIYMNNLQKAFSAAAPSVIAELKKRNMEGYYFESCDEMVKKILSMLPENSSIAWGGSESFKESGMLAALIIMQW